jgi:hypothetical protein
MVTQAPSQQINTDDYDGLKNVAENAIDNFYRSCYEYVLELLL